MSLGPAAPVSLMAGGDGGLGLVLAHLLRQIGLDDGNFRLLFAGEIGASAGGELLDRVAPLLHHLVSTERMSLSEILSLPDGRASMSADLMAALTRPQRADAILVAGLHRRLEVVVDLLAHPGLHRWWPCLGTQRRRCKRSATGPANARARRPATMPSCSLGSVRATIAIATSVALRLTGLCGMPAGI